MGRSSQTQGRRLETSLADSVGQAALFQEHEGQAAELLPVVAADDGLLVSLGDGHRIAEAQLALFDQHGVAEGKQFGSSASQLPWPQRRSGCRGAAGTGRPAVGAT